LLDGYMEDLATDRIYRLMIAQRMRHSRQAEILDDSGTAVEHAHELIGRLFDEQLDRLLQEKKSDDPQIAATLREARRISEEMIRREEFDPR
jgi:malate synthase